MKLTVLDYLPQGLLERPASALYQQLDDATLIHIPGRRNPPLVISVLQHGNENTGWEAIRRLLKSHYQYDRLPRSILLYIGNVRAAHHRVRHLEEQPDYNRCWPGSDSKDSEFHQLFREVTDYVAACKPFASIDIHNNTGRNPHYAAVNRMNPRFFHLASLFSNTVIYFTMPAGVQSKAFGKFCPAVTLECGQAGNIHGTDHTMAYLETCLHLDALSANPEPPEDFALFHMVATVRVLENLSFGFNSNNNDINFVEDLDQFNFHELPTGTVLAQTNGMCQPPLVATSPEGAELTDHYFNFATDQIRTTRPLMPSMLSVDKQVIRQDCLCYLMQRLDPHLLHKPEIEPLPEPTAQPGAIS